jgi:uncharacterized protein (DUF305 family)
VSARTASLGTVWRAAAILGLISSTYSTIISQLTAGRIGRDALVDWMVVGSIALRDDGLREVPTWWTTVTGIIVHQSADFSWDMVFFVLLSRWSSQLGPWSLLFISVPWAIFTSGVEWMFFVPLIPFWWPLFSLEQAWWLGIFVHMAAASTYPLFPFIRDRIAGIDHARHRRFAVVWTSLGIGVIAAMGALAFAAEMGRELPHSGRQVAFDQSYMVRMAAHHAQGVELARLGAEKATDPHLQALGRLMVATQEAEIEIFRGWWRSWFGSELPQPAAAEHAQMPCMLTVDQMGQAAAASGPEFGRLFVQLMSFHHRGAIAMADEALHRAGDVRLQLMAHGIRHGQQGEINLMHGLDGLAAVQAAARAFFYADAADWAGEACGL